MFTPKLRDSEDPASRELDIQRLIPLNTSHTMVEGSPGALPDSEGSCRNTPCLMPDHAGLSRIMPEYP